MVHRLERMTTQRFGKRSPVIFWVICVLTSEHELLAGEKDKPWLLMEVWKFMFLAGGCVGSKLKAPAGQHGPLYSLL